VSPARYFIAAAIVLLLGAAAMPTALNAYGLASSGDEIWLVAIGVWAGFVLATAIAGPILLTIAGIISLLLRSDD
jgi:hypothetical protein